jgi:hypothetical protein
MRAVTAMTVIASLAAVPGHEAYAKGLTEEQACRIHGRAIRAMYNGERTNLLGLIHKSRQRRRAKITHPGKR